MKKVFFMLVSFWLLSSNNNVKAQSWVNGGNNLGAIGKLGTTSNQSLSFLTNNSERARITNGGNFGIGTGSPVTKLHVNGFGSFGNQVTAGNATRAFNLSDNNAVLRILRVDASKAPAVELISRKSADGSNVAYWDFYAEPSDASFRIRDRQTGTDMDRITILHSNGNVGIGTTLPAAKLDVVGSANFGWGIATTGYEYGITAASTGDGYGVYGSSGYVGVYGSGNTYGVEGYSYKGTAGVFGYSNTGSGIYGNSTKGNGVYGFSNDSYGGKFESYNGTALRVGTTNGAYSAMFFGNMFCAGTLFQTSDKNLKTNIREFGDAMSIINRLKPENYEFKKDARYSSLNLPKGSHYGFMAQDLEQVLPNLVLETPHELKTIKPMEEPAKPGTALNHTPVAAVAEQKETVETITIKAVNYTELIPIIVKAMQEQDTKMQQQQALIEKQNAKIDALTQLVNQLSSNTHSGTGVKHPAAYLGQSAPNPSSTSTRISYSIPAGSSSAVLMINDAAGQRVKQIQLDKSGLVDVNTSRLSSGTYSYSLVVNGASVDTKKIIVNR